jgi:hypothetical protein
MTRFLRTRSQGGRSRLHCTGDARLDDATDVEDAGLAFATTAPTSLSSFIDGLAYLASLPQVQHGAADGNWRAKAVITYAEAARRLVG